MFMIRICLVIFLIACVLHDVAAFDTPYHILKRQSNCVSCPENPPACPACPQGQECQITSQSCTQCAQSLCIDSQSLSTLAGTVTPSTKGPDTGAIAGGIVGALVVVGCVAGAFFWYIRKRRRATHDMDAWLDKDEANVVDNEKEARRATGATAAHESTGESSHRSIASTTMSHASNVIPIGYIPSPLRNTMMSTDTGYTVGSAVTSPTSPRSHPPTQFFSADDILRASLATNHRDTRYSDRDTVYYSDRDTRYSNRDSIGTTYTRASIATNAYRSTAIITAAPVPVQVRAQPKIITFGKSSAPSSPIPAVPELTAEKVAEAERLRATSIAAAGYTLARETRDNRSSAAGLGLNIPISIVPVTPRLSTISSVPSSSPTTSHPIRMSTYTDILESPILGDADSMPSTPQHPTHDLAIMFSPDSPSNVSDRRVTLQRDSSPPPPVEKH